MVAIYQVTLIAILSFVGFWGVAILYPLPVVTLSYWVLVRKSFMHIPKTGCLDLEEQPCDYSEQQLRQAYVQPALVPPTPLTPLDELPILFTPDEHVVRP